MRAGGFNARGFQAGAAERSQLKLGFRRRRQQASAATAELTAVPAAAVRLPTAAQEPGRRTVAGRRGEAVCGPAEEEPAVGVAGGEDARGAGAVLQRGGDDPGGGRHGAGGHRQRAAHRVGQQELRSPPPAAGQPSPEAAEPTADVRWRSCHARFSFQ